MMLLSWWRRWLIRFAIWLIQRAEPWKNRCLARELHCVADHYDPRPTGEWEP
jgi:hypothetical protein